MKKYLASESGRGKGMSQDVGRSPALDLGLHRFKHGRCPCCGKGKREPKGLEYRSRTNDLFCHSCRKRWPLELRLVDLQRELFLFSETESDVCKSEGINPMPKCQTAEIQTETRGLRRLLKSFVLRR